MWWKEGGSTSINLLKKISVSEMHTHEAGRNGYEPPICT